MSIGIDNYFINIKRKLNLDNYDLIRNKRFNQIKEFQKLIKIATSDVIFDEFVKLSRRVCGAKTNGSNEYGNPYDYNNLFLIENNILGERLLYSFEPFININDIRIVIPCNRCDDKKGVDCKITDHLFGKGCTNCINIFNYKDKRFNTETFILLSEMIHIGNNKYDYSDVDYISNNIKVKIYCNDCGSYFYQTPKKHLCGRGCPKCAINNRADNCRSNTIDFVNKAQFIHTDDFGNTKYCYDKVNYITNDVKVEIYCKKCESYFWQTPNNHLYGYGCQSCWFNRVGDTKRLSTTEFISKALRVHENKYDYTLVDYINTNTPVSIICKMCSEDIGKQFVFEQAPINHLAGNGCLRCRDIERSYRVFCNNGDKIIKPAIFYVLRIESLDDTRQHNRVLYKIGVTTKPKIKYRYHSQLLHNYKYYVVYEKIYDPGNEAFLIEMSIKNNISYDKFRYSGGNVFTNTGNTEVYVKDILEVDDGSTFYEL